MLQKKKSNHLWYTRSNNAVKGPFTKGMIQRFLLIGRLSADSPVSQNKRDWRELNSVPDLIPDEMRQVVTADDQQRLLQARLREDERGKDRRRAELDDFQGRRQDHDDRRQFENIDMRIHREVKTHIHDEYAGQNRKGLTTVIAIMAISIIIVTAVFWNVESGKEPIQASDCNSVPGPAMNWNHCQMEGAKLTGLDLKKAHMNNTNLTAADLSNSVLSQADLSYANLTLANLSYVDASQATFKGADFRNANLSHIDFTNADLSYADLRNADVVDAIFENTVLTKAIWVDGRLCTSTKKGQCQDRNQ
jgi:hypothetical protein